MHVVTSQWQDFAGVGSDLQGKPFGSEALGPSGDCRDLWEDDLISKFLLSAWGAGYSRRFK